MFNFFLQSMHVTNDVILFLASAKTGDTGYVFTPAFELI